MATSTQDAKGKQLKILIGEFEFTWPVYVTPIRDDMVLGCDLIDELSITVSTKRGIQVKDS